MTEELTVDVPLVATGVVAGRRASAAARCSIRSRPSASARCPTTCPQSIEYSIESPDDFDDAIHVRDLTIPADVTLLTDGDEIIAKVLAPRVEVEEVPGSPRAKRVPRARGAEGEAAGARARRCRRRRGRRGLTRSAPQRRPVANTIGSRNVSWSGVSAARRPRSVGEEPRPDVVVQLRDERLLVELGHERDVILDAVAVLDRARLGRHAREAGTAELVER